MRLILEEYTDGYTDQVKEIYKYGEEVPVKVEYRKPENAEDNIRIYVPLDINKQAVLRRLDWFIMRYSEANENDFSFDVNMLLSQVEIYDQIWYVRHMSEGRKHSAEAIDLVKAIIERLKEIPDGCAEILLEVKRCW